MGCAVSSRRGLTDGSQSSDSDWSDAASSDDDPLLEARLRRRCGTARRQYLLSRQAERRRGAVPTVAGPTTATAGVPTTTTTTRTMDVVQLLDAATIARQQEHYWGLGIDKWREAIDVPHAARGRFTYDLCLHNGNAMRREVGYIASMYDAWAFASSQLGCKVTPDTWLEIHRRAMGHPGQEFLCGRFRNLSQGNMAYVSKVFPGGDEVTGGITKEALAEYARLPERLCYIRPIATKADDSHLRSMPPVKRKTMRNYMRRFLHRFYRDVGLRQVRPSPPGSEAVQLSDLGKHEAYSSATSPAAAAAAATTAAAPSSREWEWSRGWPVPRDVAISAVARLQQTLSRMEPSRDGNTRTAVVLVSRLLTDLGYHPCIFYWPDGAAVSNHRYWQSEIERGLTAWETARDELLALPPPASTHVPESLETQFDLPRWDAPLSDIAAEDFAKRSPLRGVDWRVRFVTPGPRRSVFDDDADDGSTSLTTATATSGGSSGGSTDPKPKPAASSQLPSCAPPRAAFVCPMVFREAQRNAFFTS